MRLVPWVYDDCRVHCAWGKVRFYLFKDERVCEICLYNRIRIIYPEIVRQVRDRHEKDHPYSGSKEHCVRCDDWILETWFWSIKVQSQFKRRGRTDGH